ncbi:MAG: pilin [bacterium]|nr:pilin [bacterium]
MLPITQFLMLTASNPFNEVSAPIISLIDSALIPLLGLVGAIGTIYCVILGAKLAKAEEPQDREKAKSALKNALIGFVLIFVLIVVLKIGMGTMQTWMESATAGA